MNTLDDLRAILAVHAPTEDTALLDRAASIHSRVRVARRRRRMSAVVGAVAAVALIAAGIALPRLVADRTNGDFAAPRTVTVGGFEYRLEKVFTSRPGDTSLEVTVPREVPAQAVALLADGLAGGRATLRVAEDADDPASGQPVDQIARDGANGAVPVHFAEDAHDRRYVLNLDGGTSRTRVGVAVYQRTDRMPKGVVDPSGRTVFRQQVGSRRLLEAEFVEPGQAEATFTFSGRRDQVLLAAVCAVDPDARAGAGEPSVNVSIDGEEPVSWTDCQEWAEDAGTSVFNPDGDRAGEHSVRVWTSSEPGGPARSYPGMVLGAAAYDDSAARIIHGNRIDPVVEFDGRTWELADAIAESVPGSQSVEYSVNSDGPVLFGYAAENIMDLTVTAGGDVAMRGGRLDNGDHHPGSSSSIDTIVLPGDGAKYAVSWSTTEEDARVAILAYHLVP